MASKSSTRDYDGKIAGLYDLEETIGRGHFAVVKLAKHVFTGEKVAVKVIDKTKLDDVSKAHLFQEVRCMKLVQHPHVVRLYEVIDTQTKLYLVLEWGDGGDMYDHIMKHDDGLDENISRRYFKQIVQAISYCHKLHVVHRDLKPENVVFFEKQGIVKLTDFGFSNKFVPGKKLETSCGSLAYSAPEILLGDSYDAPAVDVWSLGVILFMLVCGAPPFQEANDSETLTMIMDCKYRMPDHISEECRDLVSMCLQREPSLRATLDDILQHPWLNVGDIPVSSMALLPLISKEAISSDDQKKIIQKMVDGKIAWKDDILKSLESDLYNHITATYYLLAERMLRRQQELTNHANAGVQQLRKQSAPNPKIKLEPLALSPRTQTDGDEDKVFKQGGSVLSLVSPPGVHTTGLSKSQAVNVAGSMSGTDDQEFNPRRCSLIQEESDDDESGDELECGVRNVWSAKSLESDEGANGVKPSLHMSLSPGTSGPGSMSLPRKPHPSNRPLHSVRSSPQLLNQISEECETDEDDDPIPPKLGSPCLLSRKTLDSPDMLRKFERRRKMRCNAAQRGTSCSSSDASDNDESEKQKRKQKLKQHLSRRDSSDTSDTDGPSGPGGSEGGGGKGFQGGPSHDNGQGGNDGKGGSTNGKGGKDSGSHSRSGRKSNGGSRQHSTEQQEHGNEGHLVKDEEVQSNIQQEVMRKISNLSISSNMSGNSVSSGTSRSSSKYIADSNSSTPQHGARPDVHVMNELNKVKTRVFHMSAKDFTDINDSFSRQNSLRDDKISLCSLDCSTGKGKGRKNSKQRITIDINSNGLIMESGGSVECKMDEKTQSKCCSVI